MSDLLTEEQFLEVIECGAALNHGGLPKLADDEIAAKDARLVHALVTRGWTRDDAEELIDAVAAREAVERSFRQAEREAMSRLLSEWQERRTTARERLDRARRCEPSGVGA